MKGNSKYRNGAEGMIQWCNENVCVPIYPPGDVVAKWTLLGNLPGIVNPKTNKSYRTIWEEQQKILRKALAMDEDGRFIYRLIVFCWMRGEGKSLLACLIQLWKFFCWPRQQIMLGANSKDQVKFVHFDIMRDIIRNSPNLRKRIPERDIQEKEIRIKNQKTGAILSLIRSISSFSGIVSNITGYTFSEIFDMKNPKFFVQLDGSIRTMPNAFGVIDSTVSAKQHVLYQLYTQSLEKKTKAVFFSYRYSASGDLMDYWNPNMDQDQLDDYKAKFPFGEYERYFLNLWSAGQVRVFSEVMTEAMGVMACDGSLLNHKMFDIIDRKLKFIETVREATERDVDTSHITLDDFNKRLKPVDDYYTLGVPDPTMQNSSLFGSAAKFATLADLKNMTETFDTDWAVLAGIDMADPYAVRGKARTILTIVAKGLPGSRSNPHLSLLEQTPKYLYLIMGIEHIEDNSVIKLKDVLEVVNDEFDGIDVFCSERYGAWDIGTWCEDRDIVFEAVFPNYDRQRECFKEVFLALAECRLKAPKIHVPGSRQNDILREEMSIFDHDTDKRWFGSPEKMEKHGIQDDVMFSLGWCLYGGRLLGPDDFRIRKSVSSFGEMHMNSALYGKYA